MCGLFPCAPILEVFIFIFLIKKVSRDEGSDFYHALCPGSLQYIVVLTGANICKYRTLDKFFLFSVILNFCSYLN